MFTRYLHCIDHNGLSSHIGTGGQIHALGHFPDSDEGHARFAAWLQSARRGTHTILVDLPEEGFQSESIPFVGGSDRKKLISRKQAQLFYGSPFSTALSLGREKEGRRDERILFAALTRPAALEPWLSALNEQDAPLSALLTIPLLTRQLLSGIRPEAPNGLVIAFSPNGIRQTYFEQGELRFSRLSPAPEGNYADWGDACLRETQKTLQYLTAQRWVTRNTRLPAWLLLARHDFAPLLASLERAEQLDFHPVNLEPLQHHFGERSRATSSNSRPLMMRLALRASSGSQMAPPSARQSYRRQQWRTALLTAGTAIALVLASFALHKHLAYRELWHQHAALQADIAQQTQRYQQLLATLPQLPTSLESLHSVVDGVDRLAAQRPAPADALRQLSQGLEAFPDIEVLSLDWQLTDPAHGLTSLTLQAALPQNTAADPRAAINRIRAFAENLRGHGGDISLINLPFNAESDQTLRSSTDTLNKRPEFKLRLQSGKRGQP